MQSVYTQMTVPHFLLINSFLLTFCFSFACFSLLLTVAVHNSLVCYSLASCSLVCQSVVSCSLICCSLVCMFVSHSLILLPTCCNPHLFLVLYNCYSFVCLSVALYSCLSQCLHNIISFVCFEVSVGVLLFCLFVLMSIITVLLCLCVLFCLFVLVSACTPLLVFLLFECTMYSFA